MKFLKKLFSKSRQELSLEPDLNKGIIEFDNHISELCNYGSDFEKLNSAQKVFYLNQTLEREVNNGGLLQYFYNSSGDLAHETIKALNEIGASRTARILLSAIEKFPKSIVPKNQIERQQILEIMQDNVQDEFDRLDQAFFKYEDDLNELNIAYIRSNIVLFKM